MRDEKALMGQDALFWVRLAEGWPGVEINRPEPSQAHQGLAFLSLLPLLSRRKSKQALRDYKKVQIQLENLESSVRDRCKKEFTGETQWE